MKSALRQLFAGQRIEQFQVWQLVLVIFLIPSNLFIILSKEQGYVSGLLSDYLLPKLYAVDLALIGLLAIWLWRRKKAGIAGLKRWKWQSGWISAAIVLAGGGVLVKSLVAWDFDLLSLWYPAKLVLAGSLFVYLASAPPVFKPEKNKVNKSAQSYLSALAATVLFQSLVGLYQFFTQKSLLGYWFFGEPNLSNPIGLAKANIVGAEYVLPYGTTAHPNVLAGVVAVYMSLLLLFWGTGKNKWLKILRQAALLAGIAVLTVSFSLSAWLVLVLGVMLAARQASGLPWKTSKVVLAAVIVLVVIPLGLIYFAPNSQNPSVYRRAALNEAAMEMFANYPGLGIGLNRFTAELENFYQSPAGEITRFVQPAHHVGLLWLADTGIAGIGLVAALAVWLYRRRLHRPVALTALVLSPALALDHYLLTQSAGLLTAALLAGMLAARYGKTMKPKE